MEDKNTPAFPRPRQIIGSGEDYYEIPASSGLTKREWFAGMALQGLLASDRYKFWGTDNFALQAVMIADDVLTELEKPQP
jgi:hypothetical protein